MEFVRRLPLYTSKKMKIRVRNEKLNKEDLKELFSAFQIKEKELGNVINPIIEKYDLEKKEILEVCQIGKFVSSINSEIKIVDKPKPPSPDFIIDLDENLIGLEHTRILTKNRAKFLGINSIVEYSEGIYREKFPNDTVHAILYFQNDEFKYKQKDKLKIAESIVELVKNIKEGNHIKYPEFISDIRTTIHSKITFSYQERNSNAENLSIERLKEAILKKESKIDGYKLSHYDLKEYWLVLLIGSCSSISYELDEKVDYSMESKFDRVYLLEDFNSIITRVK